MISQELRLILAKTRMNRAFGEALGDFARRSGLEDIQSFSEVFLAARKSGGELVRIIARTAEIIAEKIRIQEDIHERHSAADRFLYRAYVPGLF